jgi:hypothetical protein
MPGKRHITTLFFIKENDFIAEGCIGFLEMQN